MPVMHKEHKREQNKFFTRSSTFSLHLRKCEVTKVI